MNDAAPSGSDRRDDFGRRQTAHPLRAARAGSGEAVEWAFAALPESRQLRLRLRVEHLVADEDHEAADAVIARGLRHHPDDGALLLLSAQSLEARGMLREADRTIRRVLAARPHHVGALLLAARVARAVEDHPRAIELLGRAVGERPQRDDFRGLLCEALLEGGCVERAVDVLGEMHAPSPVLCGLVLARQNRVADAIEWLDESWRKPCFADERDAIVATLLDLLEQSGQPRRLERLLAEVPAPGPDLSIRAARSWLQLGAFRRAIRSAAPLRTHGGHRGAALATIVVAAAMLGRDRLAARAFTRLQAHPHGADAIHMAELSRSALFARAFRGPGITLAASEPKPGLLRPLLDTAAEVLREAARGGLPVPAGLTTTELARSRAVCLAAAGHDRAAAAALAEAGDGPEPVAAAPDDGAPTADGTDPSSATPAPEDADRGRLTLRRAA